MHPVAQPEAAETALDNAATPARPRRSTRGPTPRRLPLQNPRCLAATTTLLAALLHLQESRALFLSPLPLGVPASIIPSVAAAAPVPYAEPWITGSLAPWAEGGQRARCGGC
ncbi:hypothetical protein GGTG_08637 [Gaeumannomyces tritici R3-111a-1]|uniref:Uncharacterized protein n=1 Tax=Gaeumannomyces tritici (strain R3-111a-1) TaxID=644352 RepID=J3P551_GAET3|nr:hypothetical protein GGTG_08637 [Gaeumannomyces tritici R3-111a-1]EJT74799.1 hypothetical protein GGTG_08637 [Gaeumannomyces tritici R3-111a-1]